jgi:type I restriction enzyme, S subunit
MSQAKALPKEWKWVKLGEICKEKEGMRRPPFGSAIKKEYFVPNGYKVYEQSNAIYDDAFRGRYFIDEDKFKELKNFEVQSGDLLVSCSGTLGRVSEIPNNAPKGVINQALLRIRLKEDLIYKKYFLYHFRSTQFQRNIFDQSQGTAMTNLIGIKDFKEVEIPLPPLSIQAQIVEKLETLLSELDKGKAQLLTAQAQLKTYRQAVLKYAFEGKLTGNTEGWQSVNLKDVCKVLSGFAFKSSDFVENGIPVIKIGNVGYSEFHWKEQQFVSASALEKSKSFRIFGDEILIALTRPITNNVLKVCKYPLNSGFGLLNQRVAAIKDITIDEKYLFAFFQTEEFKKYLKSKFSETLQPNLSPKDLELAPIPFPPLSIQTEIVTEIERRLSVCDHLEGTIKTGLAQSETLRQSLLKQAFEGRLV